MGIEKVAIQVGAISISAETEGNAIELLKAALAVAREELMPKAQASVLQQTNVGSASDVFNADPPVREGTINSVAAVFGGGSGREVLYAAAIYLTFFAGKAKWTRSEWMEAAKVARDWKTSYSSGAARDIGRMVKAGEINENAADVFSLSTTALAAVEPRLG